MHLRRCAIKKWLIISAFCAVVAFVAILFCLPYWINDFSCSVYREEVEKSIADVPEITVLEVVSGCGNSSGTGNHTDLYVAALIETSLSEKELENKIADVTDIHDVSVDGESTLAMEIMNLSFNEESHNGSENRYILEFSKRSPCSAFDMRGH